MTPSISHGWRSKFELTRQTLSQRALRSTAPLSLIDNYIASATARSMHTEKRRDQVSINNELMHISTSITLYIHHTSADVRRCSIDCSLRLLLYGRLLLSVVPRSSLDKSNVMINWVHGPWENSCVQAPRHTLSLSRSVVVLWAPTPP